MRLRTRIGRVEETARRRLPGPDAPLVVLHMPINGRHGRPPGEYPMGPNAVMVLYDPADERGTEPTSW